MTESGHHDFGIMIHEVMIHDELVLFFFCFVIADAKNEPLPEINTCTLWFMASNRSQDPFASDGEK